jgi:hypothetical protein
MLRSLVMVMMRDECTLQLRNLDEATALEFSIGNDAGRTHIAA